MKKQLIVLGTGGTIAGSGNAAGANVGYTAGSVPVDRLLAGIAVPAGFGVAAEQVAQLDSKDMDGATWQALARRSAHWLAQPDVAGVVVTHGTDTIEETAFFLDAVLPAGKPVVLTCAMRPTTALVPDGPQNLQDALAIAAHPGAAGVVVTCAGAIHAARHVRKEHPYRVDAFGSGDAGVVGYVEEGRVRLLKPWPVRARSGDPLAALGPDPASWPRVEILTSHAGSDGRLLDALVRERQEGRPGAVAGIVLAGTGNGSLHRDLEAAAQRARAAGIAVLRASRCPQGSIVAQPGDTLPDAGELSPVKARIALLLQLAGGA